MLYKNGFIKLISIINIFNLNIVISSLFLVTFLYFFTASIDFMKINQIQRIFYLSIEVVVSIIIYFSISRMILKKPVRELFY